MQMSYFLSKTFTNSLNMQKQYEKIVWEKSNVDCEQSLFSSKIRGKETCKRDCERDLRAAMPRAASSVGVGRRVKRVTALVSYNDLMLL